MAILADTLFLTFPHQDIPFSTDTDRKSWQYYILPFWVFQVLFPNKFWGSCGTHSQKDKDQVSSHNFRYKLKIDTQICLVSVYKNLTLFLLNMDLSLSSLGKWTNLITCKCGHLQQSLLLNLKNFGFFLIHILLRLTALIGNFRNLLGSLPNSALSLSQVCWRSESWQNNGLFTSRSTDSRQFFKGCKLIPGRFYCKSAHFEMSW